MNTYSVLQFTPDPVGGETINVGVIAIAPSGETNVSMLKNWTRVSSFLGSDAKWVRRAAESILGSVHCVGDLLQDSDSPGALNFTTPRSSRSPIEELASQIAGMVLVDREVERRASRTKRVAISAATDALERLKWPDRLSVIHNEPIRGRHTKHEADIAVKNGHVLVAAQAISFDRRGGRDLERDINEMAWLLDDVQQGKEPPKCAVLVVTPQRGESEEQRDAAKLFQSLGASVVDLRRVGRWASQVHENLVAAAR